VNWLTLPLLLLCLASSYAEPPTPLQRARLRKVVGDPEQVAWSRNNYIRTGRGVRVELEFEDSTLVRIGSNAAVGFTPGTRNFALDSGVALLHASKKSGPVQLKTANVTVSGFDFMTYNVGGNVKVVALKKRISVSDGSKNYSLNQAQLLDVQRGGAAQRKEINLDTLMATSLLGEAGGFSAFPGVGLMSSSGNGGAGYSTLAARETAQTTRAIESARAQAAQQQIAEQQAAAAAAAAAARVEADRIFLQQQQQEAAAAQAAQQASAATSNGGGGNGGQGNQGNAFGPGGNNGGGNGNNGNNGNNGGGNGNNGNGPNRPSNGVPGGGGPNRPSTGPVVGRPLPGPGQPK
jgi:hypothetical protein